MELLKSGETTTEGGYLKCMRIKWRHSTRRIKCRRLLLGRKTRSAPFFSDTHIYVHFTDLHSLFSEWYSIQSCLRFLFLLEKRLKMQREAKLFSWL